MGFKVEDSPQVINPSFAGCCCCPFVVVVVCCCCCCLAGVSSLATEEINFRSYNLCCKGDICVKSLVCWSY